MFDKTSCSNLHKSRKNSRIHPWFITGFIDAECSFGINIKKNSRYKLGYYVNPGFSIALHKKDEKLLLLLQEFFGGIGVVKTSSRPNMVEYRIFAIKDLDIILNHFYLYPLITKKGGDYSLFKEALGCIKNKQHLTREGLDQIKKIKGSMNKNRKY